jgi:hypothetical protein
VHAVVEFDISLCSVLSSFRQKPHMTAPAAVNFA